MNHISFSHFNTHQLTHSLRNSEKVEKRLGGVLNPFDLDKLKISNAPLGKITRAANQTYDVRSHFSFIDEIKDLTNEEKETLFQAIEDSAVLAEVDGDIISKYAINNAQTKFQLEFIAEQIIPKPYQAQMKNAIDTFMQKISTDFEQKLTNVYQAIHQITKEKSFMKSHTKVALNSIKELEREEHRAQVDAQIYSQAFNKIRASDYETFISSYEEVLNIFAEKQRHEYGGYWNASTARAVEAMQDDLRTAWNHLLNHFPDYSHLRLSSKEQPFFDKKV